MTEGEKHEEERGGEGEEEGGEEGRGRGGEKKEVIREEEEVETNSCV